VAQIYGVGLITTRLSGLAFEIGIFVGLGGILVCSFLGGMRRSPGRRWRSTSS
jgi:cation/acetate symporter